MKIDTREYLIDNLICSEEEIEIAEYFNGENEETYNDLIFLKCGYRDIEQFLECEDIETYNEYFGGEDEDEEE